MQCGGRGLCGGRIAMKNFSKEFYKKFTKIISEKILKKYSKKFTKIISEKILKKILTKWKGKCIISVL